MVTKFVEEYGVVTTLAYVFGVIYLIIGVLGFVPAAVPDGKLLGLFAVNDMHNLVHVAFGVLGVLAGYASGMWPRTFFKVSGIIYVVLALVGFYMGDGMMLGMVANNMADAWLHLVLGVVSLYIGFWYGCGCCCGSNKKDL